MRSFFALTSAAQGAAQYVDDVFSAYTYDGNSSTKTITNGIELFKYDATTGDQVYTTPGTYSWTCPAGVTSVCVACLGGGASGLYWNGTFSTPGGGGGGMGWKNNIAVTPGNTYTVVVGAGGAQSGVHGSANAGQDSYFISTATVKGGGAPTYTASGGGPGGTWTGDSGFNGGNGGASYGSSSQGGGGGGGAATLSSAGGTGQSWSSGSGQGGAGGGGTSNLYGGTTSTTGGSANASGNLNGGNGQNYGGGGGGHASNGSSGWGVGTGAGGLVRIMWGAGRAFPSTNMTTAQLPDTSVGGLVWTKSRTVAGREHMLVDTVQGVRNVLSTTTTSATTSLSTSITAFNTNGYAMGSAYDTRFNSGDDKYVSFTFKRAPKFFDVVAFSSNAGASASFSHSLGDIPGMIVIKSTNVAGHPWLVWHRSLSSPSTNRLSLNSAGAAAADGSTWTVSSTSVSITGLPVSDAGWIAYVFAHNADTTNGIIQCGSYTTDGSGNATVNLGWEPQFVLTKVSNVGGTHWSMFDAMRGINHAGSMVFYGNLTNAEGTAGAGVFNPLATGFQHTGQSASRTFIYLAIRRPNKPPTTGTQVYNAIARNGSGALTNVTGAGFAPDMVMAKFRTMAYAFGVHDRLRGALRALSTDATGAEAATTDSITAFGMDGWTVGADGNVVAGNAFSNPAINYTFKRAPGVFDVVCYTGAASTLTINHALGVVPELVIAKVRSNARDWVVYFGDTSKYLQLNTTAAQQNWTNYLNTVTSTAITVNSGETLFNENSEKYVAYLFATKAGISKVGSFVNAGASVNVDCGFTTGARFILAKNSTAVGDWFVWDTARGIVAANDPSLKLNSSAAEASFDDIDPLAEGFIFNGANFTNGTWIYLAFA